MTAKAFIALCQSYRGANTGSVKQKEIIDFYNRITPLPRGYTMRYSDPWCAAFLSALAYVSGIKIPYECSAQKMLSGFKERKGRGEGRAGDFIFFDWNGDAFADHVGIITDSTGTVYQTLEGNKGGTVAGRSILKQSPYIVGIASPVYTLQKTDLQEVALSVIRGNYGNGQERIDALTSAGYDAGAVQKEVNRILKRL